MKEVDSDNHNDDDHYGRHQTHIKPKHKLEEN